MISWEEFTKIDMRIGTIVEAKEFHAARLPAFLLHIDFGSMGIKKSSAQLTKFYNPSSLIGTQVIAVMNFPPKQIANMISECLVLGIYDENKDVVLLQPAHPVSNGLKIG